MIPPKYALVIPSRDEGRAVYDTVTSAKDTAGPGLKAVVVVDDHSLDGSCDSLPSGTTVVRNPRALGCAGARNAGAAAVPDVDVIVFADAHTCFDPDSLNRLVEELTGNPAADLACPTIYPIGEDAAGVCGGLLSRWSPPYEWEWYEPARGYVGMAAGGCVAVKRPTFRLLGGFDAGMYPLGGDDVEFSLRAWLMGANIMTVPDAHVGHLFKERLPDFAPTPAVMANHLKVSILHLAGPRLARIYSKLAGIDPGYLSSFWDLAHTPEVLSARAFYQARRLRTDSEWFDTFCPQYDPMLT